MLSTIPLVVCFLLLSLSRSFQCTETGAHGTCGASAPSSVDLARGNACVSATTRRPNMEEKAAWAQTGKLCLVVCLTAQWTVNGVCGLLGPRVQPRVAPLNVRGHVSVIIHLPHTLVKHARGLRNKKSTAGYSHAWVGVSCHEKLGNLFLRRRMVNAI